MIFSSTAEYFPKFARAKAVNAKAEESEAWEDSSSDASNYSEETTGYEWCSISSTTAQEKDGKIAAFVTEIRSIDDVMRHEEQQQQALAAAIEQAQLANRQKVIFYLV